MAMQLITTGASSSTCVSVSPKKYDVFISFRGEDTRCKFTSHLYEALRKRVRTFIDDSELEKGDEISSALIEAIEESYASIVVFSKDYASSKWCLNELVKILECKKDLGQIVIPIFYEVDPSHVRNQSGSYEQAFAKHEQDLKHSKEMLKKWKDALSEAANSSGWDSYNYRIESDFIKKIVEDVLKQLNHRHPFEVNKELVGIDKNSEEVESLLKIGSNDVRTLVLWGMGGIGKTTLAENLYAKYCSQFQYHCFVKNARSESVSTSHELNVARNNLFSTLTELRLDQTYVGNQIFSRKLACERSLIVLDDVATLEQAEKFNIVNNCLAPGSRVIVTTRDKQICSQFNECPTYEVKGLNKDDSLELFCLNAFREKHAKVGYEELSKRAIGYCRGNPLALKVLGANLRTKSKKAWESELEKIKENPNPRIHDVLKLSYIDLDRTQRDIFLDIACFIYPSINSTREYMINLFNACKFHPTTAIEVLQDKALITLGTFSAIEMHGFFFVERFEMHDLLAEMGREIVKQESPKDPGRRSRLWDPEEVYHVLKYNKGTDAVEVILFDTSEIGDLFLSSKSFESMINLRFLHITNDENNIVHLPEGLERLSDKLSHLRWDLFPLESLPSTFCAERLVHLNMSHSKLKKLWDGIQKLDYLTIIRLDYSTDLIEIPDLSRAPNLQLLSLVDCVSLRQLHPSIFTAPKLEELYLSGHSSLVEFSVTSEEMTYLSLSGTAINEFPSSIWQNSKLIYLNLSECKKLNIVSKWLPKGTGLGFLLELNLSGCTQINTLNLWLILDGAQSLKILDLKECYNLETLPDNIQNCLMLKRLYLDECRNLESLPMLPKYLETLSLHECRKLKSLPKLSEYLSTLRAMNCISLDTDSIQREILDKMLDKMLNKRLSKYAHFSFLSFLPGAEVPCEFDFNNTKASIVLPPIPKYGLSYFVLCIILSEGYVREDYVDCAIYEHGKEVHQWKIWIETGILDLNHVLLRHYDIDKLKNASRGDHYNISFEFKLWTTDAVSTEIKGCGVIPVYDRKVEIVELQSSGQVSDDSDQDSEFDIDVLQHQTTIGAEVRDSTVDQQQIPIPHKEKEDDLNDKSSCECSIVSLSFDRVTPNSSDEFDQHSKFDIEELQHRAIEAEVDDQQQLLIPPKEKEEEDLNDKSSCDCLIGLLLKHLVEESKRLFLKQNDKTIS